MKPFINSSAFKKNQRRLLRALEDCLNVREISEEIFEIVDRLIEISEDGENVTTHSLHSSSITQLVLKLYDEASEMYDNELRESCLDIIDKMIENRIGNMVSKLEEIDR